MKKIKAIIARASDGFYGVHCEEGGSMFLGGGETVSQAKEDMLVGMQLLKEAAIEDGTEYPSFLDTEFEIVYTFDTKSLLEYYSGILSLSGLSKISGIHQKQLWSYLHGKSTPRRTQIDKIEQGLHNLGHELTSISL